MSYMYSVRCVRLALAEHLLKATEEPESRARIRLTGAADRVCSQSVVPELVARGAIGCRVARKPVRAWLNAPGRSMLG